MKKLVHALYSKRVFILATVVAAIASCLWLNSVLPKAYESTASFYVPSQTDVLSLTTETGAVRDVPAPAVFRDQLRAFFGILTSTRVAQRASDLIPGHPLFEIRRAARFQLNSTGLFQITAAHRNPFVAAQIANAYVQSFDDLFGEISLPRATRTRQFIEEQLQSVKADLASAEARLQEFQEKNHAISIADETSRLLQQYIEFRGQTRLADVAVKESRARIQAAEEEIRAEERMKTSSTISVVNPRAQELQGKSAELEVELAGLASEVTPEHPDFAKRQQQLIETKRLLGSEAPRIVASETVSLNQVYEGLRQDLLHNRAEEKALEAKLQGLEVSTQGIEDQLQKIPGVQIQVEDLVRSVQHLEEIQKTLSLRLEDARIQEKREIQTFLVVDKAEAADTPAYPNALVSVPASALLGGLGGAMLAVFLVFLESRSNRRAISRSIGSLAPSSDSDPIRVIVQEEISKMVGDGGQQSLVRLSAPNSPVGRAIFGLGGALLVGVLCGIVSQLAGVLFVRTLS